MEIIDIKKKGFWVFYLMAKTLSLCFLLTLRNINSFPAHCKCQTFQKTLIIYYLGNGVTQTACVVKNLAFIFDKKSKTKKKKRKNTLYMQVKRES